MQRTDLRPGLILDAVLPAFPYQQTVVLLTVNHPETQHPVVLPFPVFEYMRSVKEVENLPLKFALDEGFGSELSINGALTGYVFKMTHAPFGMPKTKLVFIPKAYFTDEALATASERLAKYVYKLPWFKSLFTSTTHELIIHTPEE